jgi:hypothetical protein
MTDFRDDCKLNITVMPSGAIEYQSSFAKRWPRVDWVLLWSIIEDHIIGKCSDDDDEGECINWPAVWAEWDRSKP